MEQPTFADLEYAQKKRKTRREKFLEQLQWAGWRLLSQARAGAAAVSLVGNWNLAWRTVVDAIAAPRRFVLLWDEAIGVDAQTGLVHSFTTTSAKQLT